jgi:hypothetical protein
MCAYEPTHTDEYKNCKTKENLCQQVHGRVGSTVKYLICTAVFIIILPLLPNMNNNFPRKFLECG